MGTLYNFFQWLSDSFVGSNMRDILWLFPTVEAFHILGAVPLVSSICILSLRLTGLALNDIPVTTVVRRCLPWAWFGFLVQLLTGFLLFSSEATLAYINTIFQIKMLLIVVAAVNAFVF